MTHTPLNLETLFGDKYRVFTSEDHEPGCARDPWNFELRGPGGAKVYPYSGTLLCAYVRDSAVRKGRLLKLPGVEPFQVGDDEAVVRFKPEALPAVADYLRLYVRKQLSDDQRAAAGERLAVAREARAARRPAEAL